MKETEGGKRTTKKNWANAQIYMWRAGGYRSGKHGWLYGHGCPNAVATVTNGIPNSPQKKGLKGAADAIATEEESLCSKCVRVLCTCKQSHMFKGSLWF